MIKIRNEFVVPLISPTTFTLHKHLLQDPAGVVKVLEIVLLPGAEVHDMAWLLAHPHRVDHLRDVLPRGPHLLFQMRVVFRAVQFFWLALSLLGRSKANLKAVRRSIVFLRVLSRQVLWMNSSHFEVWDWFILLFLYQRWKIKGLRLLLWGFLLIWTLCGLLRLVVELKKLDGIKISDSQILHLLVLLAYPWILRRHLRLLFFHELRDWFDFLSLQLLWRWWLLLRCVIDHDNVCTIRCWVWLISILLWRTRPGQINCLTFWVLWWLWLLALLLLSSWLILNHRLGFSQIFEPVVVGHLDHRLLFLLWRFKDLVIWPIFLGMKVGNVILLIRNIFFGWSFLMIIDLWLSLLGFFLGVRFLSFVGLEVEFDIVKWARRLCAWVSCCGPYSFERLELRFLVVNFGDLLAKSRNLVDFLLYLDIFLEPTRPIISPSEVVQDVLVALRVESVLVLQLGFRLWLIVLIERP